MSSAVPEQSDHELAEEQTPVPWWKRSRTRVITVATVVGTAFVTGAMGEAGAKLAEWLLG
ncbi:hypothetical protein ACW9HJ_28145 [Nocardia gipuzkoensis]